MIVLVDDEIQGRVIKSRRGGTVTMVTYLTDLCLGASFHAVIVDLPSKEPE